MAVSQDSIKCCTVTGAHLESNTGCSERSCHHCKWNSLPPGLLLKESLGCHSWTSILLLQVGNKRQVIQKDDGHSRCHRGQRNLNRGGTLQFLRGCKHWRGALVHWEGQGTAETMALNLAKQENHHTHIKASIRSLCRPLHSKDNCKAETS